MPEPAKPAKEEGFMTLEQQLADAGIDVSQWGKGAAKTFEHLQKEIDSGEMVLVKDENGELLRRLVVGKADILYTSPEGKKYRLVEEKQVFKDGRERRRDLGEAISEKMKPDENPTEATARGVQEELGIEGDLDMKELAVNEERLVSPSYPGLTSQYILHRYEATLKDEQFKQDGYIEEQPDKSTYFVWKEVL